MRSSSSSSSLALLLVVMTGVLPLVASSRDFVVVTTDGVLEDYEQQLLMMERFHGWMAEHGRSYATAEEKLRRFEIYRSNVEFIDAANRDGRLTYTLGENQFTDLTHEEFLATYTSRAAPAVPMTEDEEMVITTRPGDVKDGGCRPASSEVPGRVNWTDRGKVTKVKNQEGCRSCWAFSAVAAIESAYAIKKGVEPPVLSEQELIDCDRYDSGCESGKASNAFTWVIQSGIASDSSYPYRAMKGTCKTAKHAVTINDWYYVKPKPCEEQLMKRVAEQPVAVAYSTDECFRSYKSGLYNGHCIKDGVYIQGSCSTSYLDHALTIVGYVGKGNDTEKYWIAKNSWGEHWGNKGYALIKKDVPNPEGLCGLAIEPVYPVVR